MKDYKHEQLVALCLGFGLLIAAVLKGCGM